MNSNKEAVKPTGEHKRLIQLFVPFHSNFLYGVASTLFLEQQCRTFSLEQLNFFLFCSKIIIIFLRSFSLGSKEIFSEVNTILK